MATYIQSYKRAWSQATEDRLSTLTSILGSMNMVKMLGYQPPISDHITQVRDAEIGAASKVQWMIVYHNASGLWLGLRELV